MVLCRIPITKGKLNMGTWQVNKISPSAYTNYYAHMLSCFLIYGADFFGLIENGSEFLQ